MLTCYFICLPLLFVRQPASGDKHPSQEGECQPEAPCRRSRCGGGHATGSQRETHISCERKALRWLRHLPSFAAAAADIAASFSFLPILLIYLSSPLSQQKIYCLTENWGDMSYFAAENIISVKTAVFRFDCDWFKFCISFVLITT